MKNFRVLASLLIVTAISFCGQVMAQSTIFNIPTTDTVTKKKVYAEFDFLAQAPAPEGSRIYIYNPRAVVGAPGNVEFGVNFPITNYRSEGESATAAFIQPNAKWKIYGNDKNGLAFAVGGILSTPLNHRDVLDSWGLLYGVASKKFKAGDYSPRLHVGAYGTLAKSDSASYIGSKAGAIAGYEQPIYKRLSFVADWFSGTNNLGYFTPGVSISLPKNGLLNAGYSIGNDSWKDDNATKNRYLFIYYGITF